MVNPTKSLNFYNLTIEDFTSNVNSVDALHQLFLDMYEGAELENLIQKLTRLATSGALWLVNDFTVPESGLPCLRAKFLLKIMYLVFRASANLQTQRLENPSPTFTNAGWNPVSEQSLNSAFIISKIMQLR